MKNAILEDIKKYAVSRLNNAYGYCGLADSDDKAWINSDDKEGKDIKIIIEINEE